ALLTELAAIRSQEATLLEEMEVLRNVAEVDALPDPEPVAPTPQKMVIAVPARDLQRLHAQLRQAREQKEVLKQEVAVGEREEQLLRKELEEVEQQLRLSRDDAERKRSFIATLQVHCSGEDSENLEAQAERQAELQSHLAKARQSLASKDARLKALRAEAAEAKRLSEARRAAEAADAKRSAADLARTKALRSELRRKEKALQELWAQSEVMESRLEESYCAG
ncbi:iga, partial [Symbiodinium pilosum]